ncbi:MAG: ABC transporter substrate-binding protein [Acidobacteriota bacterium]
MRTRTLIAMLALAAAAVNTAAQAPAKVRLQLNWLPEPEFGGIYAAKLGGAFARHGLDVEILKGGPDVPAVQMAAAGRVEFAVAAADEVVSLRDKGADVVAIFATYQTSPQGIMVKAAGEAKDIPDLLARGGTLIAQPGLAYLKHLRREFGLEKMKIVPYGSGALAQFLDPARSDVAMQCFVFAEPLAARRQGVEPRVFLVADTGFNPYTAVVVTRGSSFRADPGPARRIAAALREGWREYLDDPGPANREMARLNTAMDLATFAEAAKAQAPLIESEDTRRAGLGTMTEARWKELIGQLAALEVIRAPIPARDCFANP